MPLIAPMHRAERSRSAPGRLRISVAWILAISVGGRPASCRRRTSVISRRISLSDSAVLSVCTGANASHGRWPSASGSEAVGAVGPVLVLAQVHVEARGELAAEHAVGDVEVDESGVLRRRAPAGRRRSLACDGAGLVDQVHARLPAGARPRRSAGTAAARRWRLPVAEVLARAAADFGRAWCRRRRSACAPCRDAASRGGSATQVLARQRRDRRLGAAAAERHRVRHGPRRTAAAAAGAARRRLRPRLLLLDAGDPGRAHALDLLRVEARLAQHVGQQRQRRVEVLASAPTAYALAPSSEAPAPRLRAERFGAVAEARARRSSPAPSSSMPIAKLAVPSLRPWSDA